MQNRSLTDSPAKLTKTERRERVLNMWADGFTATEIADCIGSMPTTVGNIVIAARERGDRRAVRRTGSFARADIRLVGIRKRRSEEFHVMRACRRRRQLGQQFPSSLTELQQAVRASDAPITKLPASIHVGWRPSWL
jgi:hypothetical protein